MDNRRNEVAFGVVLPLVIVAAMAVLSTVEASPGIAVAFMATAPLIAAMFTRALLTGVVSAVTVLVAAIAVAVGYPLEFLASLWIVVGVILAAGIAVIASQAKAAPVRRVEPAGAMSGSSPVRDDVPAEQSDGLTGLPTREGLQALLASHPATTDRTIAVIDADHLVVVNDTYGRAVGDTFLFAVAGRTRYALPEGDVVARWGDEEFVVVTAATDEAARDLLTLIADKVNQNPIRTDAGLIPQTISVGAAPWPASSSFDEAFAAARRAMYRAKAEGGARLVVASASGAV